MIPARRPSVTSTATGSRPALASRGACRTSRAGTIGAVGAQPDEPVRDPVLVIEGVDDRPAHLRAQPADPVVSRIGEIIKPGKAKVAKIGQDEALGRESRNEIARMQLLSLIHVIDQLDPTPLLESQVKQGGELA